MTVLVIGALFVTLTGAIATQVLTNLSATKTRLGVSRARFAAYSGLQHAVYELKKNPSLSENLGPIALPSSSTLSYAVEITNNRAGTTNMQAPDLTLVPPGTVYCAAIGVDNESESVSLHAMAGLLSDQRPILRYSAFSDHSFEMRDSSESLSYDPADCSFSFDQQGRAVPSQTTTVGDIGSNRYISLLDSSRVEGQVYRPPGAAGSALMLSSNFTQGSEQDLPLPVKIPRYTSPTEYQTAQVLGDNPGSLFVSQTGEIQTYKELRLSAGHTLEVGPGEYFFPDGLDIHGTLTAHPDVNAANPIVFFVGEGVELGTSARVNLGGVSAGLQIYFVDKGPATESPEFRMSGGSQFFGTVVGNQVEGVFQGDAELYGGYLGRSVSTSDQAKLLFDESLALNPLQIAGNWGLSGVTEPKPEKILAVSVFTSNYVAAVKEGTVNYQAPIAVKAQTQTQTATF